MILLVHMLFGAAIGSIVKNPMLAVFLALLGHYFLDIFPHIEYLESTEESIKKIKSGKWQEHLPDMLKVFLDFCLGILAIFIFSNPPYLSGLLNRPIIYVCAFIALIPDGLTVLSNIFTQSKNPASDTIFNKIFSMHDWFNIQKVHFLKHKKFSKVWRITTQVLATIISIILLKI